MENTEIIKPDKLQEVAVQTSNLITSAGFRTAKAKEYGENILKRIQTQGMSNELDDLCQKYLVNCRTAKTEIENQRKPYTAYFDNIRKMFTELEATIDVAKNGTIAYEIQNERNKFLTAIKQAEAEAQRQAQNKLDLEKEQIFLKTEIEKQVSMFVQAYISERKNGLLTAFNSITLQDFDARSEKLKSFKSSYKTEHLENFVLNFTPKLVSTTYVEQTVFDYFKTLDLNLIKGIVDGEIDAFVKDLIQKLPSKLSELQAIEKANEAEKAKLEKEKAEREAKDQERIKAEQEKANQKATEEAETKAIAENTNAIFDSLATPIEHTKESREGFQIVIKNKIAYTEIFQFWLSKEMPGLDNEKIEKKSIGQMKSFCEKHAHKNSEFIKSENLEYVPIYKAVNRKQ